jgi:prolyl-tRNA synthetase
MSTRLIGTLIMAHGDDDGVIMPPRIAPTHVVILPVTPKEETREAVLEASARLAAQLREQRFHGAPLEVEVDRRDLNGGVKNWEWIKKGVPLRVELGPRDLEKGSVAVSRRDRSTKEKEFLPMAEFVARAPELLQAMQNALYARALAYRNEHTRDIDTAEDFYAFFTPRSEGKPEIHGGFARAHWDGTAETEAKVKEDLKVTIRCIPTDAACEEGRCVITGRPSRQRVLWAKSY